MRFKRFISTVAALLMGAAMTLGSAVPAAADNTVNVYPLFLRNGSTSRVSMVQKAMTGGASTYSSGTLTIPVQKFSITMGLVSGNGYLEGVTLYIENGSNDEYDAGTDTLIGVGTVTPALTTQSPSDLIFNDITSEEYALLQDKIVDADVTYGMEILSGSINHTYSGCDFTLHDSFVSYPTNNLALNKEHATADDYQ